MATKQPTPIHEKPRRLQDEHWRTQHVYRVKGSRKDSIDYTGKLELAHDDNLSLVETTIIQIPHDGNGNQAVVRVEVKTDRGVFTAHGTASPENTREAQRSYLIEMAETRAKSRAFGDATNTGDDDAAEPAEPAEPRASDGRPRPQGRTNDPEETGEAATGPQLRKLAALGAQLGNRSIPERLTKRQASDTITAWEQELASKTQAEADPFLSDLPF